MAVDHRWWILWVLLLMGISAQAQGLLLRPVEVRAANIRLSEALAAVARDGHFQLSYNAELIPGDSIVTVSIQGTAGDALRALLGSGPVLKESGTHVIVLGVAKGKSSFNVQGKVLDALTGAPVVRASVYEVQERYSGRSNASGDFQLEVSGQRDRTALLIARAGYNDTVVYVGRDGVAGTVVLQPREKLEYLEARCLTDRCGVDEIGLARLLVPAGQMDQAVNFGFVETRRFQFSVVPTIGTNKEMSGAIVNKFSFNLLGGYARGLDGMEIAGLVNIERRDVKGFQMAGLANLVGGETRGVQVGGLVNHSMRSMHGLQIGGAINTVWDTLSGVQIGGVVNVVKGSMTGVQVAGGVNVSFHDVDGVQVAGLANFTPEDVEKTQVAGGFNFGRNVLGSQVAGALNVAMETVGGGQVAGAVNVARQVSGGQVAGVMNFALDTVRGGQVGVLNIGRVVHGGQVGIINLSDTIIGASVGIFSFAWRGYHRLDLSVSDVLPLTLAFRTGTRQFHNIFTWSPATGADEYWGFGYGFGSEARLGGHDALNFDVVAEQVNEQDQFVQAVNIVGRFSIAYSYTIGRRFVISAGPNFSLLISDRRDAEDVHLSTIAPDRLLFDEEQNAWLLQGWIGFRAGVGLRF